ncbi:MAG: hypothetical protein H7Z21_01920 [Hymenobacter sp.]|nr:hypothetical protein [Hymenobacter sp.]
MADSGGRPAPTAPTCTLDTRSRPSCPCCAAHYQPARNRPVEVPVDGSLPANRPIDFF